jgi:ketosteroid isomerase-like protein
MDGITVAVTSGDRDAIVRLYAPDAVVESPDGPRIEGAAAIADYHLSLKRAFPDASYE